MQKPKRIVHVITTLISGGTEMMLYRLLRHSAQTEFQHEVVVLQAGGPVLELLRNIAVPVHEVRLRNELIPRLWHIPKIAKLVRHWKPDIIHGWMPHGNLAAYALWNFMGKDAKLFWSVRQSLYDLRYETYSTRALIKFLSKRSTSAQAVIYNSKVGLAHHLQLGFSTDNQYLIANGFDLAEFSPMPDSNASIRASLGLPKDVLLVGMIGRYHPMKDHQNLLNAAKLVCRENEAIHFVLAGRGVDKTNKELNSTIENLGLQSRVHLLGDLKSVAELTAALDVATISSYTEAFPNALGEAMSCAVPCVATDVGDVREIIGPHGLVVPTRDSQALGRAILYLLSLSAAERRLMGFMARARIEEHFCIEKISRQYVDLYQRSLAEDTKLPAAVSL